MAVAEVALAEMENTHQIISTFQTNLHDYIANNLSFVKQVDNGCPRFESDKVLNQLLIFAGQYNYMHDVCRRALDKVIGC